MTPIERAAAWLASTPESERPHPIIPAIRERFGLSAVEACEAIRQSHRPGVMSPWGGGLPLRRTGGADRWGQQRKC